MPPENSFGIGITTLGTKTNTHLACSFLIRSCGCWILIFSGRTVLPAARIHLESLESSSTSISSGGTGNQEAGASGQKAEGRRQQTNSPAIKRRSTTVAVAVKTYELFGG